MTRFRVIVFTAAAILAAAAAAHFAWRSERLAPRRAQETVSGVATDPIVYYRDPDGRPTYASAHKKTADGRDYLPVRASEDISFEDKPAPGLAAKGGERRIRFYRHPMGLPDTSPVPKKDSMGMDYVPVYEDEARDDSTVRVSQGKLQKTGVRSEPLERRILSVLVRASGRIEFDPSRISVVSLRFEGFIESIENFAEGDYVRKGQPLMRIYGPNLSSAAAEYVAALKAPRDSVLAPKLLEGARRRLVTLGLNESAIAAMERDHSVPRAFDWPAPQDGHIIERAAINGMRAGPGDTLFRIVDHSTVWVLADVAERDIGLISPGQATSVRLRAYPDRAFSGRVALIYPHLNAETRTGRVRIELPNRDGLLMGDMYADVEIAVGGAVKVLSAPDNAIIDTGERQVVIVDKGEGRFEPRDVKIGRRGEGFVEVKSGVSESDRVVTSANFLIDAESNLKAALRGFEQSEAGK